MTSDTPRVSAVVLSYNGRHLLETLLPSLSSQSFRDFEIVVVDDGSDDETTAWLAEHWPGVRVVALERNVGVAAALNRGVAAARGELVALLNNDLELDPDWLAVLVAALDRDAGLGSVAGKLLNFRRRELLDGAGDIFRRNGTAFRRGHGERDDGQYDVEEEVFAPTAGAGLYRAVALADVGPFDESFFAYLEDVDWGLRAQLAGYRTRYVPSAIAYHMGGETTNVDRDPRFYGLLRRNGIAILVKDVPLRVLVRYGHLIVRSQLGSLLESARTGMLRTHLKALVDAGRMLPRWLVARREIQRARRVSPGRLAAILHD